MEERESAQDGYAVDWPKTAKGRQTVGVAYTVKCDVSKQVAGLQDLEKQQLPFAVASTLTALAKDSQQAVRSRLPGAFTLRNDWTSRGIRIKPANKNGVGGVIQSDVHTDTANRKSGAPDYMGRQEDGGEKIPFGGRHYIAVPTKYLRSMAPGVIPAELRPRNLLGATGGRYLVPRRGKSGALRNQRLVLGFEFFIQKIKDGDMAILGRYFTDRDAYPFYLLITEAHVKKSGLEMQRTVDRTCNIMLDARWQETWRKIYLRGIKV